MNNLAYSLVDIKDFTLGENIEGICWSNSDVKILGVHFGNNKDKVTEKNWSPKIENLIKVWKTRDLTLFGKITITK